MSRSKIENSPIGNSIRKLRYKKGWTLLEMYNLSGISPQSISMYESEKTMPTIDKAFELAELLGVPLQELFYIKKS